MSWCDACACSSCTDIRAQFKSALAPKCTCGELARNAKPGEVTTCGVCAPKHDPVNAPSHYNWIPGVQPIDIAEHLPYNLGAAIKYIVRCGRKGDAVEDLRKAAWHIERQIKLVSK